MDCLNGGLSKEEIAAARNVKVETLSYQLGELYSAIGAVNQQHAVRIGLEARITRTEPSRQGQVNRTLMAASALTAVKLWSIVPVDGYPEDVKYSELPPTALRKLYRGTNTVAYQGQARKTLNLRRIGEISGGEVKLTVADEDSPEETTAAKNEIQDKTAREKLAELPENERYVAILIAAGFSLPEIEDRLSLGRGTVLIYSSTVRRTLGVGRNNGIADAIGPVSLEELPPPKKSDEERAGASIEKRFGNKKFMWEKDYETAVSEIIEKLKKAGATPEGVYPVKDETVLKRMLNERLIDESEAKSGLLSLSKLVQALLLRTSEGRRIKSTFEAKNRALRTIDELIAAQEWE